MMQGQGSHRFMLALAVALLLSGFGRLAAQNESGHRNINKQRFQELGYWYDSTTAMYQLKYPIITSIPPLSTAMPWDVLLGYVYTDSIARFDTMQLTKKTTERWSTMQDTLAGLLKYTYKLDDYNPIVFTQYLNEISLNRTTKYRTSIIDVRTNLRKAFLKAAPNPAERLALYSLVYPDYILRVKVTRIDSMLIKPVPSVLTPYKFQVTAEVLDTLKGRVFSTCNQQILTKAGGNPPKILVEGMHPCLQFQYTHGNYFDPNESGNRWLYPGRDPAFARADSSFQMQEGQEAIVFLSHYSQRFDSTSDYFDLNLEPQASFNALPIIGGQVRDVNHVWSNSLTMSYEGWKTRFFELRNKILTGSY